MDFECPYCEAEQEVNHDDGFGYEELIDHEMECSECGKNFVFQTSITFSYDAQKADCLNEGSHNFKPQTTYPKQFTKMQCNGCGKTREPSEQEMAEIMNEA